MAQEQQAEEKSSAFAEYFQQGQYLTAVRADFGRRKTEHRPGGRAGGKDLFLLPGGHRRWCLPDEGA